MVILSPEEWSHQSFMIQWIIVDCFIILLQRYYIYVCQMMMMSGEIMKNIYTLQFAQKKALEERKKKRESQIQELIARRMTNFMSI